MFCFYIQEVLFNCLNKGKNEEVKNCDEVMR